MKVWFSSSISQCPREVVVFPIFASQAKQKKKKKKKKKKRKEKKSPSKISKYSNVKSEFKSVLLKLSADDPCDNSLLWCSKCTPKELSAPTPVCIKSYKIHIKSEFN